MMGDRLSKFADAVLRVTEPLLRLDSRRADRAKGLEGFIMLSEGLESLVAELPKGVRASFARSSTGVHFEIKAPTSEHRQLNIDAGPQSFEYQLGKIWTENLEASPEVARTLLAACDAMVAGGVREVRDLQTGLLHHIYRLKTRGRNGFVRDSEYSLLNRLRLKVRRVRVTRIPALPTK